MKRQYESALEAYERDLKIDPDSTKLKFNKGASLIALGYPADAHPIFKNLVQLEPSDLANLYNLALTYLLMEMFEESAQMFHMVYEKSETYRPGAALGIGLARAFDSSGNKDLFDSLTHFRDAVCIDPSMREVFLGKIDHSKTSGERYQPFQKLLNNLENRSNFNEFLNKLKIGSMKYRRSQTHDTNNNMDGDNIHWRVYNIACLSGLHPRPLHVGCRHSPE